MMGKLRQENYNKPIFPYLDNDFIQRKCHKYLT